MNLEDEMEIELRRISEEEAFKMKITSWLMIGFAVVIMLFWVAGRGQSA